MTVTSVERKTRAFLPIISFLQTLMPLSLARFFIKRNKSRTELDADVHRESVMADGVACEWIAPQNSRDDKVLLYLHGGGFVFGITSMHLQMSANLAQKLGMRVLMVDYRLAPDHPFPAALDDCFTAYLWLLKQGVSAKDIVIAGDSAGGNLTLTVMMKLRDQELPLPAAAACLSPVVDLTDERQRQEEFKDPLLPPRAIKLYNQSYVGGHEAREPLISPIFGELNGLPPLLVHVGEQEVLCKDAIRITRLAESYGVEVRLEVFPRMWHVWQLQLALPQAIESLIDVAHFLKSHLGLIRTQPTSN
jgi:acetyl esterase/lipase